MEAIQTIRSCDLLLGDLLPEIMEDIPNPPNLVTYLAGTCWPGMEGYSKTTESCETLAGLAGRNYGRYSKPPSLVTSWEDLLPRIRKYSTESVTYSWEDLLPGMEDIPNPQIL
ncbi:hypothetical protein NPIL_79321 [Nephila pilipes]|uniref:Uncharacterized protein n=1 Tax=Nephila pilipes TaxID=299642 RepID=A0A8X6TT15_NEPPI|nr:hypothetical protein NPIL_79321 [Nephila pilipes]